MILLRIVLMMLISTVALGDEPSIKACFTQWYPYSYMKGTQPTGLSIDIYSEAIKRAGLTVSYSQRPWKRCVLEFSEGKYNAVVDGDSHIPNSLNTKRSPIPWVLLFWVREKSPFQKYTGYSQFDNHRIGYVRGYTYPKDFLKYQGFKIKKDVTNDLQGLKMLNKGRFDAFFGDLVNNHQLVKDNNLKIRAIEPAIDINFLTLSFSDKLPEQHKKFEKVLNKMYQDGSLDIFYKKHFDLTYEEFIKTYKKNTF